MSTGLVTLRNFSERELLFDDAETKEILIFFFRQRRERINTATITAEVRSFSQALLVEAIDATYALGYIEIVWRTAYNPGSGMLKVLAKIGRKAAKDWFKHATQKDLLKAKVSSRVRDQLARSFSSVFAMMLDGVAKATQAQRTHIAYVDYGQASKLDTVWG